MLPYKPYCYNWFEKLPSHAKELYPKTLARLGSAAQKLEEDDSQN